MAQKVQFQGHFIEINSANRIELLIKKEKSKGYKSLKNFEVNIHYILSSKYQIIICTEKGFYNSLNVFTDDWLNFNTL